MLWCDAAQVRQVLLNLVLNAAQATPVGGAVTVTITEERGSNGRPAGMRMVVADTGSGIDSTLLPRIFDPFFTTREEGTGLGLAIVHAVVEGHHGRVEVDSHVGQGSTFSIVLPQGPQTDRAAGVLRR